MHPNDIVLIRDFHDRYQTLSATSAYALVYDALALIREFIPCPEIGINIAKTASENPKNVWPKEVPLWVATPLMGRNQQRFYSVLQCIPYVHRAAEKVLAPVFAGKRAETFSFSDDAQYAKGLIHDFYTKIVKVGDVAAVAGLLGRHQLQRSPSTQGYYGAYIGLARGNGQSFNSREKQFIALFFDIFLDDFRKKLNASEDGRFLPYFYNAKFSARELATIKACFDLKQSGREVTRAAVAKCLHLPGSSACTDTEVRKALDKVDYDVKKIKQSLLKDFEHDAPENYQRLQKDITLEHFTAIFQVYAYCGFYPHAAKGKDRMLGYLEDKLGKYGGVLK